MSRHCTENIVRKVNNISLEHSKAAEEAGFDEDQLYQTEEADESSSGSQLELPSSAKKKATEPPLPELKFLHQSPYQTITHQAPGRDPQLLEANANGYHTQQANRKDSTLLHSPSKKVNRHRESGQVGNSATSQDIIEQELSKINFERSISAFDSQQTDGARRRSGSDESQESEND